MVMLVLSFEELREAMHTDHSLSLAVNRLLRRNLSAEYANTLKQTRRHVLTTYTEMLEATCTHDHVSAAAKQVLRKFRRAHGITVEVRFLCSVPNAACIPEYSKYVVS